MCDAVAMHTQSMQCCGEAAHALWAACTVGGHEAQDRAYNAGAAHWIRDALSRPKEDDPNGGGAEEEEVQVQARQVDN